MLLKGWKELLRCLFTEPTALHALPHFSIVPEHYAPCWSSHIPVVAVHRGSGLVRRTQGVRIVQKTLGSTESMTSYLN